MKTTKCLTVLGLAAAVFCLSGCNRYQVTLNDRTIHTPPQLFSDFALADTGLQTCADQTIRDRNITQPGELQLLNCSDGDIASLDGIEVFSQINTLNLANNQLTTIAPLLALPRLSAVNLEGNPRLDCAGAATLAKQVAGQLILPVHCR
ncbi:MAG: hypothetical protein WC247_11835 [Porticoccaceae bacterium]